MRIPLPGKTVFTLKQQPGHQETYYWLAYQILVQVMTHNKPLPEAIWNYFDLSTKKYFRHSMKRVYHITDLCGAIRSFNSLVPGRCGHSYQCAIFNHILVIAIFLTFPMKLPSKECHRMINQCWFRLWRSAIRHWAFSWAIVGKVLWHQMTSPGTNELS